jgi:hypothetical protein
MEGLIVHKATLVSFVVSASRRFHSRLCSYGVPQTDQFQYLYFRMEFMILVKDLLAAPHDSSHYQLGRQIRIMLGYFDTT